MVFERKTWQSGTVCCDHCFPQLQMIAAIDCACKSLFISAALTQALASLLYFQAFTSLIKIFTCL